MSTYKLISITIIFLACLLWYAYPLTYLAGAAFTGDGLRGYSQNLEIFQTTADSLLTTRDPAKMLTSLTTAGGLSLALNDDNKKGTALILSVLCVAALLIVATIAYTLNIEVTRYTDTITQTYGRAAFDAMINFTKTQFTDVLTIISSMIGIGIAKTAQQAHEDTTKQNN